MKKLFLILAITMPLNAFADKPETREVIYKQRTEIDFDDIDVTGELIRPAGALLLDRKRAKFNPLIRLRQDFKVEMKQSLKKVQ